MKPRVALRLVDRALDLPGGDVRPTTSVAGHRHGGGCARQSGLGFEPHFDQEPMRHWLNCWDRLLPPDRARWPAARTGGRRREAECRLEEFGFKNYADYTMTPAYQHGIERLIALASDNRVAYLCGEPMPWRCHRLIISNTLVARGWIVRHILGDAEPRVHELGRWGATRFPTGMVRWPTRPTTPADDEAHSPAARPERSRIAGRSPPARTMRTCRTDNR